MLLPTRGISAERALMTIGAEILEELRNPMSVSALWERFISRARPSPQAQRITFDWFALALSVLYAIKLIDLSDDNFIRRSHVS